MSGQIQRLARELDVDSEELAKKIPADTVRRTKYPVTVFVNEDGTTSFDHDPRFREGRLSG